MRGAKPDTEVRKRTITRMLSTLCVNSACHELSSCTATLSPMSGGVITPRRVVRSSKTPPFHTQLVQLDDSGAHRPLSEFWGGSVCTERTIDDDVFSDAECGSFVYEGDMPFLGSNIANTEDVTTSLRALTVNSCSVSRPMNGAGSPLSSLSYMPSRSTSCTEVFSVESVCSCSLSECEDSRYGLPGARRSSVTLSTATRERERERERERMSLFQSSHRSSAATEIALQQQQQQQQQQCCRKVVNVQREERIGRGSFGDVYRVVDLDTGALLAMKEIPVKADSFKAMEKQLRAMEREIRVMRKLHHECIINYIHAQRDTENSSLLIFMEYVGGGTIARRLRKYGPFREEETRHYTRQLLSGLDYLHQCHVVHRDLKGENLFLTEDGRLKVGDFGTSKELQTTLVTDSVAGTPNFMAPEVIACSGHSYMADIWSVGCCVLEMLTGRPPFSTLDNHMAVMFAIMKGRVEEEIPMGISDAARDFIRRCTRSDPHERPTAQQLREHPWLAPPQPPRTSYSSQYSQFCSSRSTFSNRSPRSPSGSYRPP